MPNHVLRDAGSIMMIDSTGNDVLEGLIDELKAMGIQVSFARTKKQFRDMLEKSGVAEKIGKENFYSSVRTGVEAYLKSGN